jgi:hydroxymethylglutaryl-CoA reductase (NADPH)
MAINSSLSDEEIIKKVMDGEIKFHELDKLEKASAIRLKALQKKLDINLETIGKTHLEERYCDANIENMIGAVQIPLGIAGPLNVNGEHAKGEFFIPLATTEGALVASVNRGCSIINKSGGASAVIISKEQTRSILFKATSIVHAKRFSEYVDANFDKLKSTGEKEERFLSVKSISTYIVGLNIWLRIKAETNDAMGMNMVTVAGKKIGDYLNNTFKDIEFISESGNMCTDKKPAAINLIESRGKRVIASIDIPEKVIKESLKTTSEKLIDMNYRKNLLGSAASGSLGFNAHFANIIAAMFIATGQDAAHVVDGSLGFTTVEKNNGGVNFSVTIPDLQVGTVGGGTGLKTQKECLSILGCAGAGNPPGNNSRKLAEIVASSVLAGEISLLGALCSKDLTRAHVRLNR